MLLTTPEACAKYPWLNRQKLHYAARKRLKFKKKIIKGRAVNVYRESDLIRYFSGKTTDAVRA